MSLPAPKYDPPAAQNRCRVGLAVEGMCRHMSDEGWQLFLGLEASGYTLFGHGIDTNLLGIYSEQVTRVPDILRLVNPSTIVVQDKREWMGLTASKTKDPRIQFHNIEVLRDQPDIFKMTVVKDAHNDTAFHQQAAEEIGCHAWIVYYAPEMVCKLCPCIRYQHVVRTYHTLDSSLVPTYEDRSGYCILSGALSDAYPLRKRLWQADLPRVTKVPHPGYHQNGSCTPDYLRTLSQYRVSICTASIYGYALRKIIESVACGCRVVTNLPLTDKLPEIDNYLIRVPDDVSTKTVTDTIAFAYSTYDQEEAEYFAKRARQYYDYRASGSRLARDIESMRLRYNVDASAS